MKKIMFNDAYRLTEAVLSGRKTQTRRIASKFISDAIQIGFNRLEIFNGTELRCYNEAGTFIKYKLPYQIGEVVAIAQSYKYIVERIAKKGYDAAEWMDEHRITKNLAGWLNKMFVKASLMIFKARITNVRFERLNDISETDCLAEGIIKGAVGSEDTHFMDAYYVPNRPLEPHILPQGAYAALIDRIAGKGVWDSNPYVFVYDFELVK